MDVARKTKDPTAQRHYVQNATRSSSHGLVLFRQRNNGYGVRTTHDQTTLKAVESVSGFGVESNSEDGVTSSLSGNRPCTRRVPGLVDLRYAQRTPPACFRRRRRSTALSGF